MNPQTPDHSIPALVSIHDVMPQTWQSVQRIMDVLHSLDVPPPCLLVVPGVDWKSNEIETLKSLQQEGYELAGHGRTHACTEKKTFSHKLHSALLSRNIAEHLSITPEEIAELINRCYLWFNEVGLSEPRLYVPPAWAMGCLTFSDLDKLPFEMYETLTGIYIGGNGRIQRLPLVGYEADTRARAAFLRISNACNRGLSHLLKRPLRISIHPHDLNLKLASDLTALLRKQYSFTTYKNMKK